MVIATARGAMMMALMGTVLSVTSAWAQVTPAAGYVPPDDTPSLRVGLTLWPQFILQTEPQITDAAGNTVQPQRLRRRSCLHQRDRPAVASRGISCHAGHHARERSAEPERRAIPWRTTAWSSASSMPTPSSISMTG